MSSQDKQEKTQELRIYVSYEQSDRIQAMQREDAGIIAAEHPNWGMTTCGGVFPEPVRKYNAMAFTPDPGVTFKDGRPGQLYYKTVFLGDVLGYTPKKDTDVGFYVTRDIEAFHQFCRDHKCFDLEFSYATEIGCFSFARYGDFGKRVFE